MQIPENVSRAFFRTTVKLRKRSPQLLMIVGTAGVLAGTVAACRATLKVEPVLEESERALEGIKRAGLDEEEAVRAKFIVYGQTTAEMARLYALPAAAIVGGIGCFVGSNHILNRRVAAASAAYTAVSTAFQKYQDRVAAELGSEKAAEFRRDMSVVKTKDENGKTVKRKVATGTNDDVTSEYARFFDEFNLNYSGDREQNLFFLNSVQNHANDILRMKGHLFLNEVYDMLGLERSKAGQLVGWVWDQERSTGDRFVDFGLADLSKERVKDFVELGERSVYLDFNVDGVILDLI